jgi:hypothetical protein
MKKVMSKKLLVLCFAATAVCMAPLAASAIERLVIKDDADNITFKVCDTGVAVGNQFSMGTLTPQAPFHVNLPSNVDGLQHPVGTALYNVSTGAVLSSQDNSAAVDLTVADGLLVQGRRGAVRGVRARGTLENPTAAGPEDQVVSLLAGVYDGTNVLNTADINLTVDGPVSTGIAPVRISFKTKPGGAGNWVEHMTIKNDGKVGIGSTEPTSQLQVTGLPVYADNADATAGGLTPGAFYRTATGVLMVCY